MARVISLFSGVGGIDLPFVNHGHEIVFANDFEPKAVKTYNLNFDTNAICADITKVDPNTIPDADILVGGFPCQPFSVAGYRRGFEDTRGTLFFDVCRILEAKRPAVVFLENVKNLVSHDDGRTFEVILNSLRDLGYHVKHAVLNATEYGNIPQNRERLYIVGFLNENQYYHFEFPEPIRLTTRLDDIINFHDAVEDNYYYTRRKYPKIYSAFQRENPEIGIIYQWRRQYVRANKSGVCPCLTANMGTGGHNVPLIFTDNGLRKLIPRECFNVQGFPQNYILPQDLADSALYKQAGNSVCVGVINRIVENITRALNN